MKTALLLLSLLFATAPAGFAADQRNAPGRSQQEPLDETEFTLHRFTPQHVDTMALLRTLGSLYGRQLSFGDRSVQNLTMLNEDLLIYETTAQMERINLAILQLDRAVETPVEVKEPIKKPSVSADVMELSSFTPRYFALHDFYGLADDLYGRNIRVDDDLHENMRMLSNNSIVLYEEKSKMAGLVHNLEILDKSQAPKEGEVQYLVVKEYHPKNLSANGLLRGMQSFQATVSDPTSQLGARANNITLVSESGVLILRDTQERVDAIWAALESLDKPAPQVMFTCYVVQGTTEENVTSVDPELHQQLMQVLPYKNFELKSIGLMRGAAVPGAKLQLDMESFDAALQYKLRMQVGAYDVKGGALNLEECRFSTFHQQQGNRDLFSTSTTVYRDEYAVLGVTGAVPLFLVVQIHPVKASK